MNRDLDRLANVTPPSPAAVDVIDRVLDKGIVVACQADRVSLGGIDLPVTASASFIVASLDTFVEHVQPGLLRGSDAWLQRRTIR
jgi:hypothetical protein